MIDTLIFLCLFKSVNVSLQHNIKFSILEKNAVIIYFSRNRMKIPSNFKVLVYKITLIQPKWFFFSHVCLLTRNYTTKMTIKEKKIATRTTILQLNFNLWPMWLHIFHVFSSTILFAEIRILLVLWKTVKDTAYFDL